MKKTSRRENFPFFFFQLHADANRKKSGRDHQTGDEMFDTTFALILVLKPNEPASPQGEYHRRQRLKKYKTTTENKNINLAHAFTIYERALSLSHRRR